MKVGRCDDFILGNITECLSCPASVIKAEKLRNSIETTEMEIKGYNPGSGEYQVANHELSLLRDYEQRRVRKAGEV